MSKNIQIDFDLFMDLITYFADHKDLNDPLYQGIRKGICKKLDAIIRHGTYTIYKTGATEEDRRKARRDYLDAIGVPKDFRWDDSNDVNCTHSPDSGNF